MTNATRGESTSAWIELAGQLTAMLIQVLRRGGQSEEATQLEVLAHGSATWREVLQAAQSEVPPPPS